MLNVRPRKRDRGAEPAADRRGWRGLTYIEILVAATVMIVLASALVPLYHWDEKRRRERQLRMALETIRSAIDQYNKYVRESLIPIQDTEQCGNPAMFETCYPATLEELVEGVDLAQLDPETQEAKTITFLYKIPVDPFTGEADWGLRSYQDDWDSDSWGGENVYDVYSLSDIQALDGTYYFEW